MTSAQVISRGPQVVSGGTGAEAVARLAGSQLLPSVRISLPVRITRGAVAGPAGVQRSGVSADHRCGYHGRCETVARWCEFGAGNGPVFFPPRRRGGRHGWAQSGRCATPLLGRNIVVAREHIHL